MILAEKIIQLRKAQGWSQEELAVRLEVSRQAVSKWESMSSMPDIDKIMKLSELFGVSTDYLLKEDASQETACVNEREPLSVREISLEEAGAYLALVEKTSLKISIGVALCILSAIPVILLPIASSQQRIPLEESAAASLGIVILLLMVAAAVTLILSSGMALTPYEYLEKEPIETEYGVAGIAESKKEMYAPIYKKELLTGIVLCILSALPLMGAIAFGGEWFVSCSVALLLVLVAIGVRLIVRTQCVWESYQKLLEEGDYTRENKAEEKRNEPFTVFYWFLVLAIYIGVSLYTNNWEKTWILWPVAALLFCALLGLKKMLTNK